MNHYQYGWLIPVVIGVVLALGIVGWFARRQQLQARRVTWVANASYLTGLPSFQSRLSRYRFLLALMAVLLLAVTALTAFLSGRPVERQARSDELASRDIVLCLDVSGSMLEFDTQIVERFLELLPEFQGERIALSVWNSTSRTVFPLTDDYTLVEEELSAAADVLDFDIDSLQDYSFDPGQLDRLMEFLNGTTGLSSNDSSLVGDGLATCGLMFDEADSERSRSIILATDNQVLGSPVYTLPEAGAFVSEREIDLFGIYAGEQTPLSDSEQAEFRDVVEAEGGQFFAAEDPALVSSVVDSITAQQAVDLGAETEVVITDRPERLYLWLVAGLAVYVVAIWRLRT